MFALLLAAAAALSPAATPPAADGTESFRAVVPVGDLDLNSKAGREAFAARVEREAVRSCAPRPYPAQYEAKSVAACRAAFRAAARAATARRVAS